MLWRPGFPLKAQRYGQKLSDPRVTKVLIALALVTRLPQSNIDCLAVINSSRPRSGAVAIVTAILTPGLDAVDL